MDDAHFMNQAYNEALKAFDDGEVPIGAVIVRDGRIIGRGANHIEMGGDATAHAEIIAIGAASNFIEDWRLNGCTLYVTLEPCIMCLGAILQSRIDRVVYGAADNLMGAIETNDYKDQLTRVYSRFPATEGGLMREECSDLMRSFFRKIREASKKDKLAAEDALGEKGSEIV